MKKMLLLSLIPLSALSMETVQFNRSCYQAPAGIDLYRSGKSFYVGQGDNVSEIPARNMDKQLREIDMATLKAMMQHCYIKVSPLSDGEYRIEAQARGLGGGPICGPIAYGITKGACWAFVIGTVGAVFGKKIGGDNQTLQDAGATFAGGTIREHAGHMGKTLVKAAPLSGPVGAAVGTAVRKGMGDRNSQEVVAVGVVACGGKIAAAIEGIATAVSGFFYLPWCP
jgi:hypothetical protein